MNLCTTANDKLDIYKNMNVQVQICDLKRKATSFVVERHSIQCFLGIVFTAVILRKLT